ncbi:YbaB/EbfC family nucleoid-associated protein [Micromonospora sp. NPDC005205]|uniref:YbaB/EbfC family nucleoid-associated protein n=1 Tax=Micromonospora sp. NPDC005205 TaxID=3156714 RepID=UPI0033AD5A1A
MADRAARAKNLSTQAQALSGTATSPDRSVEVTVDASGLLIDLRLDERVRQYPSAQTAGQIIATTRAAQADLLKRITEVTAETLGDGDPTGQAIIDSYQRRLGPDQGPSDGQ